MAFFQGKLDPKPRMPTTALGITGATTKPYQPGPMNPLLNPPAQVQRDAANPNSLPGQARQAQNTGGPGQPPAPAQAAPPAQPQQSYGAAWQSPGAGSAAHDRTQRTLIGRGLWESSGYANDPIYMNNTVRPQPSFQEKMAESGLIAEKNKRLGYGGTGRISPPVQRTNYGDDDIMIPVAPEPPPAPVYGPSQGNRSNPVVVPPSTGGIGTSGQGLSQGNRSNPVVVPGAPVTGGNTQASGQRPEPGTTPQALGLREDYVNETAAGTGVPKEEIEAALRLGVYLRGDKMFTRDPNGNEVYVAKWTYENGKIGTDNEQDENDPNDLAYQTRMAMHGAGGKAAADADAAEAARIEGLRQEGLSSLREVSGMQPVHIDPTQIDAAAGASRRKSAFDSAVAMRAALEGAANAGASPEYTSGAAARTAQEHDLAANAEETKMRLQYSIQDFQSDLQTNQNKIAALNQIASTNTDASVREQAHKWMMEAMQEQARIQEQLNAAQGQQGSFLERLIPGLLQTGGTVLGGMFGGAPGAMVGGQIGGQLYPDQDPRYGGMA